MVVKRLDLIEETLRLRIGLHPDIGNYLDAFGPAVSRLKSTLVGTGHDQVQQHNGVPGSSLSEKPNSASWSSLSKWISVARLMNSIADLGENSKIDPSTAVSDLEWAAELDTGPALDVADLDLDGVEALQLLDF